MKVFVMNNGMNVGSPKKDLIPTDDPNEVFDFPSWTLLIQHERGNLMFDTAAHKIPERQLPFVLKNLKMKKEDEPPERLRQIGLEPEDIDVVLMSHLHCDHIGYLDAFPNAKIYVAEKEFLYCMRDYGLYKLQAQKDMKHYIEKQLNWEFIPPAPEKIPFWDGLTIVNLGRGHHYGMIGLLIDLPKSGKKFLVGDAIYAAENVGPPLRQPGICLDPVGWRNTVDRIHQIAAEEGAEIWYGHDKEQFMSLTHSTEGFYE